MNLSSNKAFTLAEVLITLTIVGVVSAITLPAIMTNITERINSEREVNIAQKITQAMEQMRAHGLLNTSYKTTEDFVTELGKYLKIAKICDKQHLTECWPTETVTAADGSTFEISKAKNGSHLNLESYSNNLGLILADGSSLILNYNPNSKNYDVGDKIDAYIKNLPVGNGKTKDFPYSSNITGSIDYIVDVNGAKGPNKEKSNNKYYDIRNFRRAVFKGCAGFEIPDLGCVIDFGDDYEPAGSYTKWSGEAHAYVTYYDNYQYGAQVKCESIGAHLPSSGEFTKIYNQKKNIKLKPINTISNAIWSSSSGKGCNLTNGGCPTYGFNMNLRLLCIED